MRHMRRWGAAYILAGLFVASWIGQAVVQLKVVKGTGGEFWAATFENWQSEWFQLFVQAVLVVGLADRLFRKSTEDIREIKEIARHTRRLAAFIASRQDSEGSDERGTPELVVRAADILEMLDRNEQVKPHHIERWRKDYKQWMLNDG